MRGEGKFAIFNQWDYRTNNLNKGRRTLSSQKCSQLIFLLTRAISSRGVLGRARLFLFCDSNTFITKSSLYLVALIPDVWRLAGTRGTWRRRWRDWCNCSWTPAPRWNGRTSRQSRPCSRRSWERTISRWVTSRSCNRSTLWAMSW